MATLALVHSGSASIAPGLAAHPAFVHPAHRFGVPAMHSQVEASYPSGLTKQLFALLFGMLKNLIKKYFLNED